MKADDETAADDYEKRIREKVYNSKCLSPGEWVYLVGLFQLAREQIAREVEENADTPSAG